jgi:hypothetical protein
LIENDEIPPLVEAPIRACYDRRSKARKHGIREGRHNDYRAG